MADITVLVVERQALSLEDLCRVCRCEADRIVALVEEDVLQPEGTGPQDWRFSGASLRRARVALRLTRHLELTPAGTALVLDLLDEIDSLRARLRRAGLR
jgi:chaperone modulatory protein CbpM